MKMSKPMVAAFEEAAELMGALVHDGNNYRVRLDLDNGAVTLTMPGEERLPGGEWSRTHDIILDIQVNRSTNKRFTVTLSWWGGKKGNGLLGFSGNTRVNGNSLSVLVTRLLATNARRGLDASPF